MYFFPRIGANNTDSSPSFESYVWLLFLPFYLKAFGLTEPAYIEKHGNYAWKSLVIIGGIVLFFNTERVLKILVERQKVKYKAANDLTVRVDI